MVPEVRGREMSGHWWGRRWAWKCLGNLFGGALGHDHCKEELWEVRGEESERTFEGKVSEGPLTGSLPCGGSASEGADGDRAGTYLHDADVIGAVQLALLDYLLLQGGQVPL